MESKLDTIPLTEICTRRREVLAVLAEGQLPITDDGQVVAVLISVERWNQLVNELEDLDHAVHFMKSEARIAAGEDRWYPADEVWAELDELERQGALPD